MRGRTRYAALLAAALSLCLAAAGCATPPPTTSAPPAATRPATQDPHMRRLLEAAGQADRALAPPTSAPQEIQNLLVELTTGATEQPSDDASAFGSLGVNYGAPLPIESPFDYQVGADITKREGSRLDIHIASGLSLRDGDFLGETLWGAGLFFDYFRTREDTDLFSLRGTAGLSLPTRDHIGWRGRVALNEDEVLEAGVPIAKQRLALRNDIVWGRDFTDRMAAEIYAGYIAGDVDAAVFGVRFGVSTDNKISFVPNVEFTEDGDYTAALLVRYEFSDHKVPALITRYLTQGPRDHTPFPLQSFSELVIDPR